MLAIIPARGGSKRIPLKNVVPFRGRPLIAWTIDAALGAGCFERVVVSTDDPHIADVARAEGAEAPFLRAEAADDHATASEATLAALRQSEEHFQEEYLLVVQLFAVCPLRCARHILEALDFFDQRDARFLISAYPLHWCNPWWACTLGEDFQPRRLFPNRGRSQDLPALYAPTGAVWIAEAPALKQAGTFYGPGHVFWPMEWQAAIDIDTWDDLQMAELLAHKSEP